MRNLTMLFLAVVESIDRLMKFEARFGFSFIDEIKETSPYS